MIKALTQQFLFSPKVFPKTLDIVHFHFFFSFNVITTRQSTRIGSRPKVINKEEDDIDDEDDDDDDDDIDEEELSVGILGIGKPSIGCWLAAY